MNKPRWDMNLGYSLWLRGVTADAIASRVGVSVKTLWKASRRHGWPRRKLVRNTVVVGTVQVTRRCPGCLAVYRTSVGDTAPHCESKRHVSLYLPQQRAA
jgi:hypothetical protein